MEKKHQGSSLRRGFTGRVSMITHVHLYAFNVHFSMCCSLMSVYLCVFVAVIPAHSVNSYLTREEGVDIVSGICSDRVGARFV